MENLIIIEKKNHRYILTILSRIGKRILAQARLLVNSVKIALKIMTIRMRIVCEAPTLN